MPGLDGPCATPCPSNMAVPHRGLEAYPTFIIAKGAPHHQWSYTESSAAASDGGSKCARTSREALTSGLPRLLAISAAIRPWGVDLISLGSAVGHPACMASVVPNEPKTLWNNLCQKIQGEICGCWFLYTCIITDLGHPYTKSVDKLIH